MKTNLKIEAVETKTSKAGRAYESVKTSQGTMTCFEKLVVEKLRANIGKDCDVTFEDRNGFKNITSFDGVGAIQIEKVITPVVIPNNEVKPQFYDERKAKQASMCESYVKDLVCAGKLDIAQFEQWCLKLMVLHKSLESQ